MKILDFREDTNKMIGNIKEKGSNYTLSQLKAMKERMKKINNQISENTNQQVPKEKHNKSLHQGHYQRRFNSTINDKTKVELSSNIEKCYKDNKLIQDKNEVRNKGML